MIELLVKLGFIVQSGTAKELKGNGTVPIFQYTPDRRIYFNNHYDGKAVINAMQFKEMHGVSLSADEKRVMENVKGHLLGN